jgi:hypothetical protein
MASAPNTATMPLETRVVNPNKIDLFTFDSRKGENGSRRTPAEIARFWNEDISVNGLLSEPVCTIRGGKLYAIEGRGRIQAFIYGKQTQIPVKIKPDLEDAEILKLALIGNISAKQMRPMEVIECIKVLEEKGEDVSVLKLSPSAVALYKQIRKLFADAKLDKEIERIMVNNIPLTTLAIFANRKNVQSGAGQAALKNPALQAAATEAEKETAAAAANGKPQTIGKQGAGTQKPAAKKVKKAAKKAIKTAGGTLPPKKTAGKPAASGDLKAFKSQLMARITDRIKANVAASKKPKADKTMLKGENQALEWVKSVIV